MNPELLEYARSLGLYKDTAPPEPKPRRQRKARTPSKSVGTGVMGRPRKCDHVNRYTRKDGKGTYCRECRRVQERERYHRLHPGARTYKERTA